MERGVRLSYQSRRMLVSSLMVALLIMVGAGLASAAKGIVANEYPVQDFIIYPSEFNALRDKVQIIDIRSAADYGKGHIPGAIRLDLNATRTTTLQELRPVEDVQKILRAAGIEQKKPIVFYGTNLWATYGWWLLRYLGHDDVKVLDGGLNAWRDAGYAVSTEAASKAPSNYTVDVQKDWFVDAAWVNAHLGDPKVQILDARTPDEHKVGHIPHGDSPSNINWVDATYGDYQALKNSRDLQKLLKGVDRKKTIVVYCKSGVRASYLLFALKTMGFTDVRNFDGSWLVWEAGKYPVETDAERQERADSQGGGC